MDRNSLCQFWTLSYQNWGSISVSDMVRELLMLLSFFVHAPCAAAQMQLERHEEAHQNDAQGMRVELENEAAPVDGSRGVGIGLVVVRPRPQDCHRPAFFGLRRAFLHQEH